MQFRLIPRQLSRIQYRCGGPGKVPMYPQSEEGKFSTEQVRLNVTTKLDNSQLDECQDVLKYDSPDPTAIWQAVRDYRQHCSTAHKGEAIESLYVQTSH